MVIGFLLLLPIANAQESVFARLYYIIGIGCSTYLTEYDCEINGCYWYDDACHDTPPEMKICYEIIQIGNNKLCMTEDGRLILVITASISLIAIPMTQRKKIINLLRSTLK